MKEIVPVVGDQTGTPIDTFVSRSNVSCRISEPSVAATHRLPWPPLSERYTISFSSGLNDGTCAAAVCLVMRIAVRAFSSGAPVTGIFQRSDSLFIRLALRAPFASMSG